MLNRRLEQRESRLDLLHKTLFDNHDSCVSRINMLHRLPNCEFDANQTPQHVTQRHVCLTRKPEITLLGGGRKNPKADLPSEDDQLKQAIAESLQMDSKAREIRAQAFEALRAQLNPQHHIQCVLGDGACLFRAFARSLHEQSALLISHQELRASCVQHIRDTPEFSQRFNSPHELDAFCANMLLEDTYGDELCIHSLGSLYQVRIDVYTTQYGIQTFYEHLSPTIRLAYNGFDHFDVILHKQPVHPIMPALKPLKPSEPFPSDTPLSQNEGSTNAKSLNNPVKDTITILSINVASWEPHAQCLLNSGADILAVQEARMSELGQIQQNKLLALESTPWHAVWGKPPGATTNKFSKTARKASGKSGSGGVAIFARKKYALLPIGRDSLASKTLFESTRWCATAIPLASSGCLSRRFIHICSFYGIVNRRNDARHTQTERLLTSLFSHCTAYGQQPIILCLDANTTTSSSLVLSQALATGQWIDVGSAMTDGNPEPTFSSHAKWDKISSGPGITRPDLVIMNQAAFALCQNFRLRRDLTVKGHLGLQFEVCINKALELIKVHAPPKPFLELPNISPNSNLQRTVRETFFKQTQKHSDSFQQALNSSDMDKAWSILGQIGEGVLSDFSKQPGEGGRSRLPKFKQQRLTAAAASKTAPDQAHTRTLTKLHKILRQLQELKFKQYLLKLNRLSPEAAKEACTLGKKVLLSCKLFKLHVQDSWSDVQCDPLIASIETLVHEKQQAAKLNRLQLWRKKLRDSFDIHRHGAAAFAWVNNQPISHLHAVRNSDNEIVTSVGDMLQAVSTSWQNLFHKNSQVDMDKLAPIASSLLPSFPCDIPPISGATLKKKVMGMKPHRAVALDGWRVSELRFLPVQWFDLVAQCFDKIEQGAPWPSVCCLSSISTIPKGSADDPDNKPAGEIIAADGLQTRPITNLSPLYTAYSGCRYTQMQQWRELWLTDCMSGSRPNREIHDCSYSLALQLEYQTFLGNHSAGISMDRTKFFDLIEYPLGFHLLLALGAPQGVLQATQRLYGSLKHTYKLRRANSEFLTKGNGFPQGDSWSLQVALATMSFWTRYLKAGPLQDMAIHTGSFLDDSHFYSIHAEPAPVVLSLIKAWKRSQEFDELAGLKTNSKKSFFFANNHALPEDIKVAMQELPAEQRLSSRDSFILVGSVVTSHGVPKETNRDKRVLATTQKLHKIRFAPVRFAYRARIAGAICKSAFFGTELVPLTQTLCESLRSAIVFLLWKGKSWCRSWAVTSTHIVPVHMLNPQAACFYHMFRLLARPPTQTRRHPGHFPTAPSGFL